MECVRATAGVSDVANLWYVFVSQCSSKIALSGGGVCHGEIVACLGRPYVGPLSVCVCTCTCMCVCVRERGGGRGEREREGGEGEREREREEVGGSRNPNIMMCIPFDLVMKTFAYLSAYMFMSH